MYLIFLIMCSVFPTCLCLFELAMTISISELCSGAVCPLSMTSCSAD